MFSTGTVIFFPPSLGGHSPPPWGGGVKWKIHIDPCRYIIYKSENIFYVSEYKNSTKYQLCCCIMQMDDTDCGSSQIFKRNTDFVHQLTFVQYIMGFCDRWLQQRGGNVPGTAGSDQPCRSFSQLTAWIVQIFITILLMFFFAGQSKIFTPEIFERTNVVDPEWFIPDPATNL